MWIEEIYASLEWYPPKRSHMLSCPPHLSVVWEMRSSGKEKTRRPPTGPDLINFELLYDKVILLSYSGHRIFKLLCYKSLSCIHFVIYYTNVEANTKVND